MNASTILKPKNKAVKKSGEVVTENIVQALLDGHYRFAKRGDLKEFSKGVDSSLSGMRKLWRFVRSNITYQRDAYAKEAIQSPSYLWHTSKKGDCKSMSVFIGNVLEHKQIPFVYRVHSVGSSLNRIKSHADKLFQRSIGTTYSPLYV